MGRKKGGKGKKKSSGKKKSPTGPGNWEEVVGGGGRALVLWHGGRNDFVGVDVHAPLPFGIGTRVEIDDATGCLPEGVRSKIGTVTGHWVPIDGGPKDGEVAPYCVRLDGGWQVMIMPNMVDCVAESDAPPLAASYDLGSRVECRLEDTDEWFPGTICQINLDWIETDVYLYKIRFDDGNLCPFWGPKDCIRASSKACPPKKRPDLRFEVGDRVRCRVGPEEDAMMDGTVIQLWYTQKAGFADGHIVPYQIQLDEGDKIFSPVDDDYCISRSEVPPPSCWICFDNDISEKNLIVRDCNCRGEQNGFIHVNCLVKLAKSRVEDRDPDSGGVNPFQQCITCKQRFLIPSSSGIALAKAHYETYKGRDVSDVWKRNATAHFSYVLASHGKYEQASNLLDRQISQIRSAIKQANRANVDTSGWMDVLASELLHLGELYDEMGSPLSKMKSVLDQAVRIIDAEDLGAVDQERAKKLAASYSYKSGDKNAALECLEEALALCMNDRGHDKEVAIGLLLSCGNMNLECSNKERGLEQLSQAVQGIKAIRGPNEPTACKADKLIRYIEQGQMEKLPSNGIWVPL
ncbi:hypothetical protein ACHAXT_000050 [Thalassiosira profunda]